MVNAAKNESIGAKLYTLTLKLIATINRHLNASRGSFTDINTLECNRVTVPRTDSSMNGTIFNQIVSESLTVINLKVTHYIVFISSHLQPSAVEDLRKWTSFEAIGDITVPPDCTVRLTGNGSVILGNISQNASPSYQAGTSASFDETDDIIMVDSSSRGLGREQDTPLDHRLPSPEEQCQMIALKYVLLYLL